MNNINTSGDFKGMGVKEIKEYLPHRYPFLLLDRVTDIVLGESILGYKNLTINEHIFLGHFPDEPIFPGVMIIESMAQLSGILGFMSLGITNEDGLLYTLAGIDKCRFKARSTPGDRLEMESKLVKQKRNIWKFESTAHVDGNFIASAELICAVTEQKN